MRVRSNPIEIQNCWLNCQRKKRSELYKLSSKFKYPHSINGEY